MTTETPCELRASDAIVSALAERRDVDDPLLRCLSAWARSVDAHPIPPLRPATLTFARAGTRTTGGGAMARWAVGLTAALTVSSTGIAAAVGGDPWSPLHFVTTTFYELGHRDTGRAPGWTVGGDGADTDRNPAPGVSRSLDRGRLGHDQDRVIRGAVVSRPRG